MVRYTMICLLLCTFALGQEAKPTPAPKAAAKPTAESAKPASTPAAKVPTATNAVPDAPVITIPGICEKKPVKTAPASACQTVITKSEFEKLINAAQPNMPQASRRRFADSYVMGLILANEAHKNGLDKGPNYETTMKLMRTQVLAQQQYAAMQKEAALVPEQDIADYYHAKLADYEEANISLINIPSTKQIEGEDKLSAEDKAKQQKESEAAMKKLADDLRARAVAGEDFAKLQEEAFQTAGIKTKVPNTSMGKTRRSALPAKFASIMDMKSGEVSPLISDQGAYLIIKIEAKETEPLDKVHDQIKTLLEKQKMQDNMKHIQTSVTPIIDEKYFEVPPAAAQQGMSMPKAAPQGAKPPAQPAATTPK